MTHSTLTRLALFCLIAATGCGGARAEPEPPGPFPTPAVHEVARLQDEGSLDPERLACAAVTLESTTAELAPVLPILWSASQPRYTSAGSSHARSVQDGMAAGDRTNAAMRRAAGARRAAAAATAVGDNVRAAQAANWASRWLRTAQRGPEGGSAYVRRAPTRWTADDSQTLLEYAALFAEVVTTESDSAEAARARLAEIGRTSPHVMEAYAGLLLEVHGDPEVECGRAGTGPAPP